MLGLDESQATHGFAQPLDRAPPLPPALSIFKDHWPKTAPATQGLLPVPNVPHAVQLFQFLLIVQFQDNVHFTNTLYHAGSKIHGLVIVRLL